MTQAVLYSIVVTGFTIAFFHAAIPTHWLPFVMASRAQRWNKLKTLSVVAVAGAGHVVCTTVLGVLIVWLGLKFDRAIGFYFPVVAGGALISFGLYYFIQQIRGQSHSHWHLFGRHDHDGCGPAAAGLDAYDRRLMKTSFKNLKSAEAVTYKALAVRNLPRVSNDANGIARTAKPGRTSDKVAILSLVGMLTLSPCEAFLPVYLSGIKYGWLGFGILSLTLACATVSGMVVFTYLTMSGLEHFKLSFIEKYENYLMGALLCVLGVALIYFEGVFN